MTDAAGAVHPGPTRTGAARSGRVGLPPLRDGYQQQALAAIVDGFTTTDRGTVVAACGTGKTVLSGHAAAALVDDGLVVMACPSLPLIAQTLAEFTRFGLAADALAVCSDDTVADAAIAVSDLPCPVTTDPPRVAEWLRSGRRGRRLLLVTHLSSDVAGQALQAADMVADLLIVDEAHRTAGWAGKRASVLHRDDGLPARRRLYLTATPRVFAGGRGSGDDGVLSMDDVATFGPRLFTYPFAAAIRDGWLDDYRLAVVGVSQQEAFAALRQVGEAASASEQDRLIRTAVVQTALARAASEFGLRRIMVFCPWVKDSRQFADTVQTRVALLPQQQRPKGRLTAVHVDSTQNYKTRQTALDLLADPPEQGWTVLSNARCLSEGVDVPAVDAVVFTAPKSSPTEIIQSVGRALRRNPKGSGIATILVPVLLPDDSSWGEHDLGAWETVCQVVRALRAHDDEFAAALDRQRTRIRPDDTDNIVGRLASRNQAEEPVLPPQVVLRLPDSNRVHDLLRHITVRVLEGSTSEWWVGYGVLTRFHAEHGHVRVPWQHVQDGIDLSAWINKRRSEYRRNRLAPDRIEALNQLGLQWTPAADAEQRAIAAAEAFHIAHGHLRVPKTDPELDPLYQWLSRCRRAHHAGTLDPDTAKLLTGMGMDWQRTTHLSFDDYLALARRFHAEHGHLDVPRGCHVDGANLHHWILRQRMFAKRNELTDWERHALDQLGMVWDGRGAAWATRFAAAEAFLAREGHLSPPIRHREGGVILSKWLGEQRRLARAGQLPPDRYAALARLGLFPPAANTAGREPVPSKDSGGTRR
jgi:superfamily II DNA or RNA helicase